jgi:CUB domain
MAFCLVIAGVITEKNGVLVSPGFPSGFVDNQPISWIFATESSFALQFLNFSMSETSFCAYEYLTIYSDMLYHPQRYSSSLSEHVFVTQLHFRYCASPGVVVSLSGNMNVTFSSPGGRVATFYAIFYQGEFPPPLALRYSRVFSVSSSCTNGLVCGYNGLCVDNRCMCPIYSTGFWCQNGISSILAMVP